MHIGVVGINHNKTPIDIREKFSFSQSMKVEASSDLLEKNIDEVIILSTCNRSEIYFAAEDIDASKKNIVDFYRKYFDFENIDEYIFEETGEEAARHLFMVAGGLDSVVLGEDQILNQIKEALNFSIELKFSRKILNRLFMNALTVGKKIRTNIRISEIPISTSYIGIKMLKEKLGSLENKSALIIGAGEISHLALTYLSEERLSHIYVSNRSDDKLVHLFEEFPDMEVVDFKNRYDILKDVDVLITATAAPHTVIDFEGVKDLKNKLYIMDLGLPRDVDSKVKELGNIELYNLDDLNKVSEENLEKRKELSEKAEALVSEDLEKFTEWLNAVEVDPYIGSINEKLEDIRRDSMDFIDRKLDLDSRERKMVDKMISYALHRVTRETILTLKDPGNVNDETYKKMVSEFFDIEV